MITAIIQARLGSTRFPRKIFCELAKKPLIWHVINRLKYSHKIDKIVLATTDTTNDDELVNWAVNENIGIFRGNENNVLERYYFAAKQFSADIIVRITADDPFKDPVIIDNVIELLQKNNLDFAYNNNPATFPEGLDTEVFTFAALEKAFLQSKDDYEKEHVTQYFYRNIASFRQDNYSYETNLSALRWTIDTQADFLMVQKIYNILYKENTIFYLDDILEVLKNQPEIAKMNCDIPRSAMYK
jgi:spore coat polysaccharide biosynthesis protein SpsF